MATMKIKTMSPPPGSQEAVDMGCTCAVWDNNHGKGFQWDRNKPPMYYVSGNCPVHCDLEAEENEEKADVTP